LFEHLNEALYAGDAEFGVNPTFLPPAATRNPRHPKIPGADANQTRVRQIGALRLELVAVTHLRNREPEQRRFTGGIAGRLDHPVNATILPIRPPCVRPGSSPSPAESAGLAANTGGHLPGEQDEGRR
jgi:hypothetical protein